MSGNNIPEQRNEGGFDIPDRRPVNASKEGMILDFVGRITSESTFVSDYHSV